MFRSLVVGCLLVVAATPCAEAQQWARKMFKTTSHDFGAVARGAKVEFDFELQNIYEEDIHIAAVRSSCGCTEPHIVKDTLKTWEKGAIRAVFNTRAFIGHRSATLTVTIDRPYFAEVQLSVRGYIRADVVFDPGAVIFGEIERGTEAERMVNVVYAGRSDWQIIDVRSANEQFEVELMDEKRIGGRVSYKMLVRIKKDAPTGYFQDQLTIVTNDSRRSTLELSVEGRVVSPLTVSPTPLFLGILKPGQTATKNLIVRGKEPFTILSIESEDKAFVFKPTDKKSKLHLIPVAYTAGDEPGKISRKIRIKTDLRGGMTTTCTATATIAEPSATK